MKSISNHLHLLKNDSLSHRSSSQNVGLNRRNVVSLLVVLFESTPHPCRLPYQPISRYDGPHAAYEQHEYHKAFYSHRVSSHSLPKPTPKRHYPNSIPTPYPFYLSTNDMKKNNLSKGKQQSEQPEIKNPWIPNRRV